MRMMDEDNAVLPPVLMFTRSKQIFWQKTPFARKTEVFRLDITRRRRSLANHSNAPRCSEGAHDGPTPRGTDAVLYRPSQNVYMHLFRAVGCFPGPH